MSLRVWLPLNRDLRNLGTANYQPTGNNVVFNNYAYEKGTLSPIPANVTEKILNNNEFSFACWIYVNAEDGTSIARTIFGNSGMGANNNRKFTVYIYSTVNDLHLSWQNDAASEVYIGFVLSDVLPSYKWTHIAVTYKNPTCNVYINGQLISTRTGISNSSSFAYDTNTLNFSDTTLKISDYRIYDHALSKKEVAELARGCVLHYPMNDTLNESTTNLAPYPTKTGDVGSIGWDTSKHQGAIYVNGWSSGYNSGVQVPSTGYHAHWKMIDNIPTMVFIDKNTDIGYAHRWLGINSNDFRNYYSMSQGTIYTISFDAKSDVTGKCITGGFYYKKPGDTSSNFNDGTFTRFITTKWERYSVTFTVAYNVEDTWTSFYFYGMQAGGGSNPEGTSYVRNVQIELKDHATPYTPDSRTQTYLKDVSGFDNHSTITGSLPLVTTPKSPRYDKCLDIKQETITKSVAVLANPEGCINCGQCSAECPKYAITYDNNGYPIINQYLCEYCGSCEDVCPSESNPIQSESVTIEKHNYANCTIAAPQVKSASFWVYIGSSNPINQVIFMYNSADLCAGFGGDGKIYYYGGPVETKIPCGYDVINLTKKNDWNHFVCNHLGSTIESWLNGVKLSNPITDYWNKNGTYDFLLGGRQVSWSDNYFTGKISDFRLFTRTLTQSDVDDLYKDSLSIDKSQNGYCYELNELLSNILQKEEYGITIKEWMNGLSYYAQSNCQCTLTDNGYRIYRPANVNPTDNGSTMWGGFILHNYDNRYNLQKGHTYILQFDIKGQTTNAVPDIYWTNQAGWGGGGLTPSPSNEKIVNPVTSNYQSNEWKTFTYKWTINDEIYKTCTTSYSGFIQGQTYVSYRDFKYGFQYTNTGSLGTDLYIKNLRMYDVTDTKTVDVKKNGILDTVELIEYDGNAKIMSAGTFQCNELKEL